MDQRFSGYAIASILIALLVPAEFYAATGFSKSLPVFLTATTVIGAPLGAVILGHMARGQVRRSGYIRGGYGTGSAGMILGYLTLALYSYLCLMIWATPSLNGVGVDESMVLSSLRDVNQGLDAYAKLHPDRGYPASLEELASNADLTATSNAQGLKIETESAREEKCGYRFRYVSLPKKDESRRDSFELFADPIRNLSHIRRHFFLDQTGVPREALDHSASGRDPEL